MKTSNFVKTSDPANQQQDWSIAFAGSDIYKVPLYPDFNAIYWFYALTLNQEQTVGIRLKGAFNQARFISLSVYDDSTGNTVGSIRDNEIVADENNLNPFMLGVNTANEEQFYTVEILPEGFSSTANNCIYYPDDLIYLSVFFRIYYPDAQFADTDFAYTGGVPLPQIEVFDPNTGAIITDPDRRTIPFDMNGESSDVVYPPPSTEVLDFYNVSPSGLYANDDASYLTCSMDSVEQKLALVRMKVPSHQVADAQTGVLLNQAMVRYWSFNVGGMALGLVNSGLADDQCIIADDGFVYLIVGPSRLERRFKSLEINFLPWGKHDGYAIVMRHLVPNVYFPWSAAQVPLYSDTQSQPAQAFIGDYAPQGCLIDIDDWSHRMKRIQHLSEWFE